MSLPLSLSPLLLPSSHYKSTATFEYYSLFDFRPKWRSVVPATSLQGHCMCDLTQH